LAQVPNQDPAPSWPRDVLVLQTAWIYLCSAIFKMNPSFLSGGDLFARQNYLAEVLPLPFPGLYRNWIQDLSHDAVLAWTGIVLEMILAAVLFFWWYCPKRRRPLRKIAIGLALAIHGYAALALNVFFFSASIVAQIIFMTLEEPSPTSFLKRVIPLPVRRFLSAIVPRAITIPAYYFLFGVGSLYLKVRTRGLTFRIWPRNSLVLRSVRFSTSDIDLTILSSAKMSSASVHQLMRAKSDLQRWLPLFGEVNWYSDEDLTDVAKFINTFELERDPILFRLLIQRGHITNWQQRRNDPIEKFVFLARMIYYDGRELHQSPKLRYQKWKNHFSVVGLAPLSREKITLDTVLTKAAHVLPISDTEIGRLSRTLRDIAIHNSQFHQGTYDGVAFENPDWVWAIFPYSMGYYALPEPKLSELQRRLLERQMDWELFGMLTQHRQNPESTLLPNHLKVVANSFQKTESSYFESTIKKTEYVLSRLLYYNTI
jgi:hypothetical protein